MQLYLLLSLAWHAGFMFVGQSWGRPHCSLCWCLRLYVYDSESMRDIHQTRAVGHLPGSLPCDPGYPRARGLVVCPQGCLGSVFRETLGRGMESCLAISLYLVFIIFPILSHVGATIIQSNKILLYVIHNLNY